MVVTGSTERHPTEPVRCFDIKPSAGSIGWALLDVPLYRMPNDFEPSVAQASMLVYINVL